MTFPKSLKVSVLPFNGLFEVETYSDGKMKIIGGLESEYVEMLSRSLGFDMEVLAPEDGEWGRETKNGSWTGLVGMVLQNKADIALGGIAVTEKRAKVIYYTAPYRFTYLTFATNMPPELPRFTTFLYPFTMNLWISLAVMVIIMPFIFRILLQGKISLANHFFDTIKSLLYEPMRIKYSRSTPDYFVLGAWLIASMLISFSYAATLLSFLTIPLTDPGVQNIKQLSELVAEGKFRAGCFKGTNVVNILQASQHSSIAALGDYILKNKYDIEPGKESVEHFYKTKNSALIAPKIYFKMNFPNSLQIAHEALKCTAISMVTLKTFCCKRRLDSHIIRIFESGLSQQIVKRILTKTEIKTSLNATSTDKELTLDLEDFVGAFAFLAIGTIGSILILIGEIIIGKLKKKI